MGNRRIGYYRNYKQMPLEPISITGNVFFKNYRDATGPEVHFDVSVGRETHTVSIAEMLTLREAIDKALADTDSLIERETVATRKFNERYAKRKTTDVLEVLTESV